MNEFTNLITNVGFPIVACYVMYQQVQTMNKLFNDLSVTLKGIDTRLQQIEEKTKLNKGN